MKTPHYKYSDVTRYAAQIMAIKIAHLPPATMMRQKFPGLSDRMVKQAMADAKLLLALRRELKREGD